MMGQLLNQLRFWWNPTPREQGFQWDDEFASLRMTVESYNPLTDVIRAKWDIIETGTVTKVGDVTVARRMWLDEKCLIPLMEIVSMYPEKAPL
jgi:hypothetical protein